METRRCNVKAENSRNWWDVQSTDSSKKKKKVGSKSKWEKQWGCFPEGGSFPASTKKAPTGKQLQNKSICWEHFLLHPEDPPCHQFLKATQVHPQCSAQGATSNGTAPSRSHVELTHPGPVPAGSLQGSAPVCELPLNHLLISRLQPSYMCEALQLWHQTHLPHGGKLSSPCPAARLANDRHLLFLLFLQHPFSQFSSLPPLLSARSHPCARMSPFPRYSCPMLPPVSSSRRGNTTSALSAHPLAEATKCHQFQQPPEATSGCVWISALSWQEQESSSSVFPPAPALSTAWALPESSYLHSGLILTVPAMLRICTEVFYTDKHISISDAFPIDHTQALW